MRLLLSRRLLGGFQRSFKELIGRTPRSQSLSKVGHGELLEFCEQPVNVISSARLKTFIQRRHPMNIPTPPTSPIYYNEHMF
ncbi:hypothetical protein NQ317_012963 [Molorchus minor]|uniref:Uncharacterized protein n=1 Tax=Molorchus minor TaxID=1323400 RepID=A0ABQ9IXB9_9CUCU|nr:hypothetical protein NQ317_012963 [Molorchus minor]